MDFSLRIKEILFIADTAIVVRCSIFTAKTPRFITIRAPLTQVPINYPLTRYPKEMSWLSSSTSTKSFGMSITHTWDQSPTLAKTYILSFSWATTETPSRFAHDLFAVCIALFMNLPLWFKLMNKYYIKWKTTKLKDRKLRKKRRAKHRLNWWKANVLFQKENKKWTVISNLKTSLNA